MGEVSDKREPSPVQTTVTWSSMSTPHTPLSPNRRNRMPKLLRAGHREDYPAEFLDTVERIDIICGTLKKLESFGRHARKDSRNKQKVWSKTSEALKDYADQMMTEETSETFRRASTKFFDISQLYPKLAEVIMLQYSTALRNFNKTETKEVKDYLKNLAKVRRNLDKARRRADRRNDEATAAAMESAQKDHDECLATTKEVMLKFMKETAFFQAAASAYITAERELCEQVHSELNSLRGEKKGSRSKEQAEEESNPSNPNRSS